MSHDSEQSLDTEELADDSMAYRGTEFPKDNPLFPHHPQVKEYLQNYSRKHGSA